MLWPVYLWSSLNSSKPCVERVMRRFVRVHGSLATLHALPWNDTFAGFKIDLAPWCRAFLGAFTLYRDEHAPKSAPKTSGCQRTLKTIRKQKTRICTMKYAGFWYVLERLETYFWRNGKPYCCLKPAWINDLRILINVNTVKSTVKIYFLVP